MRRRLAALVAMSALALALSTSPALAGSPAIRVSIPAAGGSPISCGANTYTVVSGTLDGVLHIGTSASGNLSEVEVLRATNVVVEDQNDSFYRAVGVEQFKGTFNARTGGSPGMSLFKFRVLGTADSLNVIIRLSPKGDMSIFGPGTCSPG